jgi:AcrR family transcriptional regulator
MTPKMPDEHREFRRKQITAAAWECFTERGYRETTMRDIAQRMNTSTGVIYRYFDGKDEILESVNRCAQEGTAQILERVAQKGTAKEALAELFRVFAEEMPEIERRQNARGAITLWAEALKRKKYWQICCSQQGPIMNRLGRLIERGIAGNEFKIPIDPNAFAGFILALIMGLQVQSVLYPGLDTSAYYENVHKIFLRNVWNEDGVAS